MNTTILNVSGDSADDVKIEAAGNLLKEGKLVAFPTETVYGWAPMRWTRRPLPEYTVPRAGRRIIR